MTESCKTCYYMRETLIREGATETRPQCRRNAPRPDLSDSWPWGGVPSAFWPPVREDDWCGEWRWYLEDTSNAR